MNINTYGNLEKIAEAPWGVGVNGYGVEDTGGFMPSHRNTQAQEKPNKFSVVSPQEVQPMTENQARMVKWTDKAFVDELRKFNGKDALAIPFNAVGGMVNAAPKAYNDFASLLDLLGYGINWLAKKQIVPETPKSPMWYKPVVLQGQGHP